MKQKQYMREIKSITKFYDRLAKKYIRNQCYSFEIIAIIQEKNERLELLAKRYHDNQGVMK